MMKRLMIATTALTLLATPAQAQLLGNGSLTGGLGSALDINSTISRPTETLRTATRGAIEGSAATDGSQSVDRNSGRVEARRSADLAGAASVAQLATTPIAPIGANASGSGSASGEGQAQAQLIGTDGARSIVAGTVGEARTFAATARGTAGPVVGQVGSSVGAVPSMLAGTAGSISGSASGEGSANGSGSASLMSAPLAVAGSAAAAGSGAANIAPGMPVFTPEGMPVGKVREIVANSRGEVEQVLVSNGDTDQLIPAGSLSASGGALVAGEGNAEAGTGPEADPGAGEGA